MADRAGHAIWPGITSMTSCIYTLGHGVSPGIAHLKILPQPLTTTYGLAGTTSGFTAYGTLVISDGFESISLPRSRLVRIKADDSAGGQDWDLEIEDRRWIWRDTGIIHGFYNQLDPHGKLIPWTIRSPRELAILCLQAMGETRYTIDLPNGLDSNVAAQFWNTQPPWLGVHPGSSATNPPISWEAANPANSLSQLCELFGRRVVYRVSDDSVAIVRLGIGGAPLPDGSIYEIAPELSAPAVPYGVAAVGAPTKWQVRLYIEPVGEEWHGAFVPINELSYAPQRQAQRQISTVSLATSASFGTRVYSITIGPEDGSWSSTFSYTTVFGDTRNDILTDLAAQMNASLQLQGSYAITFTAGDPATITIENNTDGTSFTCTVEATGGIAQPDEVYTATVTQAAVTAAADWSRSTPGVFSNVRATERLTYPQAVDLAKKHIWKTYRVANTDISGNPIVIPGYGQLVRRQQIILTDSQVEQIQPEMPQGQLTERTSGLPVLINFYSGYSRDKPAAVFGRYTHTNSMYAWYRGRVDGGLSASGAQVFMKFSIDPVEQLVKFDHYVYRHRHSGGGRWTNPELILQTGINIRNPLTNALERFTATRRNPGAPQTPWATKVFDDMQLNVIGQYTDYPNEQPTGSTILEQDPLNRASYYLDGMQAQYITAAALTLAYNGIRQIDCDPETTQVTWEVREGDDGFCSTVASKNSEHSMWYPRYATRRRSENLAAVFSQAGGAVANQDQVPDGLVDHLFRGLRR